MSSSDTESSSSSMEVPKEEGKVTKPEDDTTMKKKEGRVDLSEEGTEVRENKNRFSMSKGEIWSILEEQREVMVQHVVLQAILVGLLCLLCLGHANYSGDGEGGPTSMAYIHHFYITIASGLVVLVGILLRLLLLPFALLRHILSSLYWLLGCPAAAVVVEAEGSSWVVKALLVMVPSGLLTGLASLSMGGGREAREAGGTTLLPSPAGTWHFAHSSKRTAGPKL